MSHLGSVMVSFTDTRLHRFKWIPFPKCSRQSRFSSFLIRFDSILRTASILQCWRFSIFSIRFCWMYKHLIFVCASRFSNFRSPFDSSHRHLRPVYSSRFSILHHPKVIMRSIGVKRYEVTWHGVTYLWNEGTIGRSSRVYCKVYAVYKSSLGLLLSFLKFN